MLTIKLRKAAPRSMLVSAVLLALGWSATSAAMEANQSISTAVASTEAASSMMEEVVVRALRRSKDKMDVPVQVTVLGSEDLRKNDILTMEDLDNKVPNTFFGGAGNYGGAILAIRGIGGSGTVFGEEPVATFVDDQYVPRNSNNTQALLDLESIEVLRGPQVTLYGRNATGGAILLRSARPDLDKNAGYLRLGAAEFGEHRVEGAFGGPLVDETFAIRVAGMVNRRDGWVTNTSNGESLDQFESKRGRVTMVWSPNDNAEAFAVLEKSSSSSRVARTRYAIDTDNSIRIPRSEIKILEAGKFSNDSPNFSSFDDQHFTVGYSYDFGDMELVVDGGYLSADIFGATDSDGTGQQLFNNTGEFEIGVYTENIRLVSASGNRFEWIVGASGVQDSFSMPYFYINNFTAVGGLGGDFRYSSDLDTSAYAVYGEGTYSFTDRLRVTAGLRGTYEKKEVDVDSIFLIISTGGLLADPPNFHDEESWTAFKPRVIVEYDLSESTNLYASVSTGFKSGGFNAFGQVPAYDEETILAYEAGLKGRYLDGRLELSSALFLYDYDDLQLRLGVPSGGISITNAASAKLSGFEAEWRFQATDNLALNGSIALLDTEFKKFVTRDLAQAIADASGNRLSRAPETQFTFGASYDRDISKQLHLSLSGMVSNRGDVFFRETDQDSKAWYGEPLTELDLRAAVLTSDGKWELAIYVQNVTNDFTMVAAEAQGDFPIASFNEPRKYGIEIIGHF